MRNDTLIAFVCFIRICKKKGRQYRFRFDRNKPMTWDHTLAFLTITSKQKNEYLLFKMSIELTPIFRRSKFIKCHLLQMKSMSNCILIFRKLKAQIFMYIFICKCHTSVEMLNKKKSGKKNTNM